MPDPARTGRLREMVAMWADNSVHQIARLEEAVDEYRAALGDGVVRQLHEGNAGYYTEAEVDAADRRLTMHRIWRVGAERYYLLLTLAQLRKAILALPADGLPLPDDHDLIRLLRDSDEHWEDEDGRSITKLRQTRPDLPGQPGAFFFNNKHIWIGESSTDMLLDWVTAVDRTVRRVAEGDGDPIPGAFDPLPDR